MPKRNIVPDEQHTFLCIFISNYSVRSEASINTNLKLTRPIFYDLEDPAYHFITTLEISGLCSYPEERAGDNYQIIFREGEMHAGEHEAKLKDYQERDEYGAAIYRKYRGEMIPVFVAPQGIATINKKPRCLIFPP